MVVNVIRQILRLAINHKSLFEDLIACYTDRFSPVSTGYGKQDNRSSGQWPNVTRECYPPLDGQTWNRTQSVWCLSSNSISGACNPAHPMIVGANNSTWFGVWTLAPRLWPPGVVGCLRVRLQPGLWVFLQTLSTSSAIALRLFFKSRRQFD